MAAVLAAVSTRRPWSPLFDVRVSPVSNGHVEPHRPDVIGTEPQPVHGQRAWVAVVVVLAIALAAAITTAIHYHAEATAEPHRIGPAPVAVPPEPGPLKLSIRTALLPSSGPVTGQVTLFTVRPARGPAQVVLVGRINGGIPHRKYALVGNDCTSNTPDHAPGHAWAAGIADAHGHADLSGPAWTVSAKDEYWLRLIPSPDRQMPGLHGSLTPGRRLTVFRAGWAPCTPGWRRRSPAP